MDEPGQELTGRDLMVAVRRILVENPERHEQDVWLGNYYLTPDELRDGYTLELSLDEMRPYALQPLPMQPEEPNSPWPVCGTTGCVAGWAAVLSAPPGSLVRGSRILFPDGAFETLDRWVARRMGITREQAAYMFNPNRDTARLIRILDALIEDPSTDPALVE